MAKREKSKNKFDVCPRLYKYENNKIKTSKGRKSSPLKAYQDQLERELEELKNEYIGISPRQIKNKFSQKGEIRVRLLICVLNGRYYITKKIQRHTQSYISFIANSL